MDRSDYHLAARAFPMRSRRRRRFLAQFLALGLLGVFGLSLPRATVAQSGGEASFEYSVKAGFLFNFAKFVTWPTNTLPAEDTPIVIGVMADDPAAPILTQGLSGKMVDAKRRVLVRLLKYPQEWNGCHVLFLGRSQSEKVADLLERVKGSPVLTVGEDAKFIEQGGIMNFVRKDDSFRFQVNLQAAEAVGLKVSGKLAGMAIIVQPGK
jgi:hypothetical protein